MGDLEQIGIHVADRVSPREEAAAERLDQSSVAERVQPSIRQASCPRFGVGERRRQSSEDASHSGFTRPSHEGNRTHIIRMCTHFHSEGTHLACGAEDSDVWTSAATEPGRDLMLTLKMVRDQLCDNGGAYPYTMVDVCGHSVSVKEDFLGVRAGPDKAEVSGSSPLRPTVEHLVTSKSVLSLLITTRPACQSACLRFALNS